MRRWLEQRYFRLLSASSLRQRLAVVLLIAAVIAVGVRLQAIQRAAAEQYEAAKQQLGELANYEAMRQADRIEAGKALAAALALAAANAHDTADNCGGRLVRLASANRLSDALAIIDGNGILRCHSKPEFLGRQISAENVALSRAVLQAAEPRLSGLFQAMTTQRLSTVAMHPITDGTGRPVLVASVVIERESIQVPGWLARVPGSVALLTDEQGRPVAHHPPLPPGQNSPHLHAASLLEAAAGSRTMTATGFDGVQRVYGVAPMSAGGGFVVVGIDEATLIEPARAARLRALIVAFGTLFGVAALLLAGGEFWLVRPLGALARTMRHTDGAKAPVPLAPSRSSVEMRELYDAFNVMTLRLSSAHATEQASIAALRTSQQQLQQQTLTLESVLEHCGVGVWAIDGKGVIMLRNRKMAEMIGLPHELTQPGTHYARACASLAALGHYGADAARDPDAFGQQRWAAMATQADGRPFKHEHHDGRVIEMRTTAIDDGRLGYVCLCTDITERAKHDELERRSARQIEDIVENIPLSAAVVRGEQIRFNRFAKQLLGYDNAAVDHLDAWFEAAYGDHAAKVRASYDAHRATGFRNSAPCVEVRAANGDKRLLDFFAYKSGDTELWLMFDVTEREYNRSALEHKLRELRDSTEALQRAHVEADWARRAAEKAARAKVEFLSSMSHEIRTPLNGVLGFSTLLSDTMLNDEQRQMLADQQEAGRLLMAVVDDILDFSKIDAEQLEICPVPTELRGLVHGCTALVAKTASEKGLVLRIDIAGDMPAWISIDAVRLRQILLNLLSNAVKFTRVGGVVLSVETGAKGGLRVSVQDTGIGIAADRHHRLFEPFSQGDGSVTREFGGTGLGLTISRRLAKLMGGTLQFESTPGSGSKFFVDLPLVRAQPPADVAPHDMAIAARSNRILVAEDNLLNQKIVRMLLERNAYEVVVVPDGVEAVSAAQRSRFDLVLMDIQMPRMDGTEATRRIRQSPQPAASVPILALTAQALPEQIEECLAAGMQGHVAKPIDKDALLTAVRQWIGNTGEACVA